MAEQKLMKDGLDRAAIVRIAKAIYAVDTDFKQKIFIDACLVSLDQLELKQRVQHIIEQLHLVLDDDFESVAAKLIRLPLYWDKGEEGDSLSGFAAWPLIDYVADAGLEHPDLALKCLEVLTELFSAEFAIRAFIEKHSKITLEKFKKWITHDNEHVRRLVSEGLRPRLPWGKQLKNYIVDPNPILPFLEHLKDDPSLYVRRSVANNLNDIAKDHPDLVINVCKKWQKDLSRRNTENKARVNWVITHATRTLVKQGHPESFSLLGYTQKPEVKIAAFKLQSEKVRLGKDLYFEIEIKSNKNNQVFVLDYAVYYLKSNGTQQAKVFKLKNIRMNKDESIVLKKGISFKKITTRRYYKGQHSIALLINGIEQAKRDFNLI